MITTNNISLVLQKYKQTRNFNSKNKYYYDRFYAYKDLILEDKILDKKLTSDILTEVLTFQNRYFKILNYIDKVKLKALVKHLEKDISSIDKNKLCNQLSYFISKLTNKEVNY